MLVCDANITRYHIVYFCNDKIEKSRIDKNQFGFNVLVHLSQSSNIIKNIPKLFMSIMDVTELSVSASNRMWNFAQNVTSEIP